MSFLTRITSSAQIILLPTVHGSVSSSKLQTSALWSEAECFADWVTAVPTLEGDSQFIASSPQRSSSPKPNILYIKQPTNL